MLAVSVVAWSTGSGLMPRLPVAVAVAGVLAPLPTLSVYAQVLLSAATVTGAGMLMVVPRSAAAIGPPTLLTAPPQSVESPTVTAEAAALVSEGSVTESAAEVPPVMFASAIVRLAPLRTGAGKMD